MRTRRWNECALDPPSAVCEALGEDVARMAKAVQVQGLGGAIVTMFNIPSCSWREALATEVKTIDEDPFMCSGAYTLEKGYCSQEHRTFLSQQALPERRGSRKPARCMCMEGQ